MPLQEVGQVDQPAVACRATCDNIALLIIPAREIINHLRQVRAALFITRFIQPVEQEQHVAVVLPDQRRERALLNLVCLAASRSSHVRNRSAGAPV